MEGDFVKTSKKILGRDTYLDLVKEFPLVTIRNEKQYDEAVAFLKSLAIRDENSLDEGESSYLDALALFVEDYQNKHHRIAAKKMTPLGALKYLMEESGMSIADLGRVLGNRSLASQVLKGNRELSKGNIVLLAKRFAVDAGLFLRTA
jgi:HTH-type transcriptional regulator / antitoxin HigA